MDSQGEPTVCLTSSAAPAPVGGADTADPPSIPPSPPAGYPRSGRGGPQRPPAPPRTGGVIARIRSGWRDSLALLFALGDRRTPAGAKLMAALAVAYALLPLDLLPDLTPVLGLADDVLIVPTLLALAARTLPEPVLTQARGRSLRVQRRLPWLIPTGIAALLLLMALGGWLLWRAVSG
ncbi:hypothetical protein GCM10017784_25710 [Deinococcus indicus]|nr:hypothetical protein GCM10017784_25710 [Deinococcus indicus]